MTPAEFSILYHLVEYGPLTATELRDMGRFPGHAWQSYSSKLVSLRRRRLVTKGTDPAGVIWRITDRGREVVAL